MLGHLNFLIIIYVTVNLLLSNPISPSFMVIHRGMVSYIWYPTGLVLRAMKYLQMWFTGSRGHPAGFWPFLLEGYASKLCMHSLEYNKCTPI